MENTLQEISTAELQQLLSQDNVIVLDVRSIDAYNGWALHGEPRGGHIRGAKSLPAKWTNYMDWIEIVRSKDITPENTIVLYGYEEDDTNLVAELFSRTGYEKIRVYHDFLNNWVANPDLPMDSLQRYRHLVPPEWLHSVLSGEKPQHYDNDKSVLVHAHYRNPDDYSEGHIPGAIPMDTRALESTETWNRRSPEELKAALEEHGISHDTTVIVYGRFSYPKNDDPYPGSSAGHLGAIRCAAIMMYAGVKDVRILNGGIQSWEDAGFDLTTDETKPEPIGDFGTEIPGKPELFVDLPEAKELLKSSDGDLISVRSWPEFIGEVSGYNYIEPTGRIPGAIFGNCGSDAYHMENYRNLDHTTREYHEIAEMWKEVSITPYKHLAFYCGTGWRGSEAFYNAWLMGWPRVSVFDGGWFEWSADPGNPTETGEPHD